MKVFLIATATIIVAFNFLFAGDLFFSEYVEGSSSNKALEIYNPTDQTVSLSNYILFGNANEATGWEYKYPFPDGASIAPGDVYVIVDDQASAQMLALADWIDDGYTLGFNGNDGRGLMKINGTDTTLIDVIGFSSNPNGDFPSVAGVANALLDHTLIRKPSVTTGNTDWTSSAGTNATDSEWIILEKDDISNLGMHSTGSTSNYAPTAYAGTNQTVGYGSTVTLDGSGSTDPDGIIVSYAWSQISGTSVSLSASDEAVVTFTAPDTDSQLEFTLTVVDDSSASDIDTVMITVVDGSDSPIFFSEYIEGSSNNKAIEIYNASESAVNMSEYIIKSTYNGSDWNDDYYSFPEGTTIQPGAVYVLANNGADQAILNVADETLAYNEGGYVVSFNGNDARGLFRNGLLVDVIGVAGENPGDTGWDVAGTAGATANHTLIRKSSVVNGNPDWNSAAGTTAGSSEWIVNDIDVFDNLGIHTSNPDAPTIANVTSTNDFPTSNTELEITATITAVTGHSIASARIKYGSGGVLGNSVDMWQDNGDIWMGAIPSQPAYTELEYQVVATDDAGNYGESASQSVLIADANLTEIATIRSDKENYIGNYVTIKGIVTIGSGVIDDYFTDAYIQDASGRGLNIFNYDLINGLDRGDELIMVGKITEYNSVLEITDFNYKELSTGNDLPEIPTISLAQANSLEYEGTLVRFNGFVRDSSYAGYGTTLTIESGGDTTYVRIWDDTGIDIGTIEMNSSYWFTGVINPYSDDFQLIVGYDEDIARALGIADDRSIPLSFKLEPAYPNPFNPTTRLVWQLPESGTFELSAFNLLGQKVAVITKGYATPGYHAIDWDARDLPSGAYFIQLSAGSQSSIQKVLLLK